VRAAIQNAASVAALLITTEAVVAELPKKNAGGGGMPAAAWAAWISDPRPQASSNMQNPGSNAGFLFEQAFDRETIENCGSSFRGALLSASPESITPTSLAPLASR